MGHEAQLEAKHAPPNCVYLSNLPYEACEGDIATIFSKKQIPVRAVQLLKKGSFNRTRNSGLACVTLQKSSDVELSCKELDGKLIHGRPIIIRRNKFEADQPNYSPTEATAAAAAAAAAASAAPDAQP